MKIEIEGTEEEVYRTIRKLAGQEQVVAKVAEHKPHEMRTPDPNQPSSKGKTTVQEPLWTKIRWDEVLNGQTAEKYAIDKIFEGESTDKIRQLLYMKCIEKYPSAQPKVVIARVKSIVGNAQARIRTGVAKKPTTMEDDGKVEIAEVSV